MIEVTVAGHTGEFILDTGAEETLVDRKFLGLKKSGGNLSDGLAMSAAPADVRDFCIASHCFGKTRVRLMDFDKLSAEMGSPVSGMIGQDLLQKFDAVTIDYKNHFVELEPAAPRCLSSARRTSKAEGEGMLELGEICMRRLPQYCPELGQGSRTVEIKEEFPGEVTITANKKGLDVLLGPETPKKERLSE